jgi:hypothetical protein
MDDMTKFFLFVGGCYALGAFFRKKNSEKLKREDPEEWAKDREASRARNRAVGSGALKVARHFLKR